MTLTFELNPSGPSRLQKMVTLLLGAVRTGELTVLLALKLLVLRR